MGSLLVLMAFYFLPTILAIWGNHHNGFAIFALNLLLGWTLVGWVLALVWSLTNAPRQVVLVQTRDGGLQELAGPQPPPKTEAQQTEAQRRQRAWAVTICVLVLVGVVFLQALWN